MKMTYISLALFAGAILPVQSAINAQLGVVLNNPLLATFISFVIGSLFLAILLALLPSGSFAFNVAGLPWYLLLGGVLGGTYIFLTILTLPKIGVATLVGAAIVGQLLLSVLIDHFGLLGVVQRSINVTRVVGILLLFTGFILIKKD